MRTQVGNALRTYRTQIIRLREAFKSVLDRDGRLVGITEPPLPDAFQDAAKALDAFGEVLEPYAGQLEAPEDSAGGAEVGVELDRRGLQ